MAIVTAMIAIIPRAIALPSPGFVWVSLLSCEPIRIVTTFVPAPPPVRAKAVACAPKALPKRRTIAPKIVGARIGRPTCRQYWREDGPRLSAGPRHPPPLPADPGES